MGDKPTIQEEETRLLSVAMETIAEQFELPESLDPLAYHNRAHTAGVIKRADKIAAAAGLNGRERFLTRFAAAMHDTVQLFDLLPESDNLLMRRCHTGANEEASAEAAVELLRQSSIEVTDLELSIVKYAIMATTPSWDSNHKTVFQPLVTRFSHPVVHCVALADLGEAGMDPHAFVRGSYALFAEDQVGVMQVLGSVKSIDQLSVQMIETIRLRLLNWLKDQPDFVRGRRMWLSLELSWLDSRAQELKNNLFNRFEETEDLSDAELKWARSAAFVPLMRKLSPSLFPNDK